MAIRIPKFFRFCKKKRIATPVCALARNDIALFDGLTAKSEFNMCYFPIDIVGK